MHEVTKQALLKRVNRRLARNYEAVQKRRNGPYDYVDTYRNVLLADDIIGRTRS